MTVKELIEELRTLQEEIESVGRELESVISRAAAIQFELEES